MREFLFAIVRDLAEFGTPHWRAPAGSCPRD